MLRDRCCKVITYSTSDHFDKLWEIVSDWFANRFMPNPDLGWWIFIKCVNIRFTLKGVLNLHSKWHWTKSLRKILFALHFFWKICMLILKRIASVLKKCRKFNLRYNACCITIVMYSFSPPRRMGYDEKISHDILDGCIQLRCRYAGLTFFTFVTTHWI